MLYFGNLLILLILDELETLLKQKDNESMSKRVSDFYSDGKGKNPSVVGQASCLSNFILTGSDHVVSPWHRSAHDVDLLSANSISRSPPQLLHAVSISEPSFSPSPPGLEMVWTARPSSLPSPELLQHLYVVCFRSQTASTHWQCTICRVEVFFKFHPHAGRLFHATSFMTSLSLPPVHPRFPSIPVLHAICAIGSFYTSAVTSPPLPDFNQVSPGR